MFPRSRRVLTGFLTLCAIAALPATAEASAIAAGEAQSCRIDGGAVKCWGSDSGRGALGTGVARSGDTADPQPAAILTSGVSQIDLTFSGGGTSTTGCAVKSGGAFCWGSNDAGQYGNGTTTSGLAPTPVSGLGSGVTEIDIATASACAVQNGAARCWGSGHAGRLGDGTGQDRLTPVTPHDPTPGGTGGGGPGEDLSSGVTDVAAGWRHSCAIKNGDVFCFGDNTNGQLGYDYSYTTVHKYVPRPPEIQPPGTSVEIVAGPDVNCVRNDAGAVHCWGYNNAGQVGAGTVGGAYVDPQPVVGLGSGVTDIAANNHHLCALKAGEVWCWGDGQVGKLGNNPPTAHGNDTGTPAKVAGLSGVTDLAVGGGHTCAIAGGQTFCWGTNNHLQLGTDEVESWTGVPRLANGSHPKPPPAPKPPAAPAPAAVVPPRPVTPVLSARIAARPSSRLSRARTATLARITCPAGATCRVTAPRSIKLTIRRKRFTATITGAGVIRAGRTATLGLRLSKAAARRLGRRSVTAALRITTTVNGRTTGRDLRVKISGR